MTNFHVQWTASARQDLEEIIHYIAEDSTTNAFRLLEKIEHRANSLNQYPNRGRFVPELLGMGISTYRELVIRPWRLLYRIEGKHVYVIALLDSHRNLADILLVRLIREG